MKFLTDESTLFFLNRPENLALWEDYLAPWLEFQFPEAQMIVQKTQITLKGRISFLAISIPPRKFVLRGQPAILVTFGLGRTIQWNRIVSSAPISRNRITYHTLVQSPDDLDETLLEYLKESWEMASQGDYKSF